MLDETRLHISVESRSGHLIVDGPMTLWRELMESVGQRDHAPSESLLESDRQPAEAPR